MLVLQGLQQATSYACGSGATAPNSLQSFQAITEFLDRDLPAPAGQLLHKKIKQEEACAEVLLC